ncbi:MAG: hypothetical protein ACRYGR_00690 [Janthinobacterium lividum]
MTDVTEVMHPGEALRVQTRQENLAGAAALRQAQREAAHALAPALRTMGKPAKKKAGMHDGARLTAADLRPSRRGVAAIAADDSAI